MKKTRKNNATRDVDSTDLVGVALGDFVKGSVRDENDIQDIAQDTQDLYAKIKLSDHSALNKVLLGTLNPQLRLNEMQKRDFKETLMKYIRGILITQIVLVSIPILLVIVAVCFDIPCMNEIESDQMQSLFDFLKYYIGAIIVEFIAMLFFIVKYVFDKSIVDLTKAMADKK